jgi:hypothetical protein
MLAFANVPMLDAELDQERAQPFNPIHIVPFLQLFQPTHPIQLIQLVQFPYVRASLSLCDRD